MTDPIKPEMPDLPEPCIVHMRDYDDDCEVCATELTYLQSVLTAQSQGVTAVESRLNQMGIGLDRGGLAMLRINTLISTLAGDNPKVVARFEIAYAVNVSEVLRVSEEQAMRQRLLQGIQVRQG